MSNLIPKNIVEALTFKDREQVKNIYGQNGSITRRDVLFVVYRCPKAALCTEESECYFEKGKGLTNPYKHLK